MNSLEVHNDLDKASSTKRYREIASLSYGRTYVIGSIQFRELKKLVICQKSGPIHVHETDKVTNSVVTTSTGGNRTLMKWDEKHFFVIGIPGIRFSVPNSTSSDRHTVLVFTFSTVNDSLVLYHSFQGTLSNVFNASKLDSNTFVSACQNQLCIVDFSSTSVLRKIKVIGVTIYSLLILSKLYKCCFYANFDDVRDGKPLRRYNQNSLDVEQTFIHEDDVYTNTFTTFLNRSSQEMLVAVSDSPPIVFLYNTTFTKDKHLVKKFIADNRIFYSDVIIHHPEEYIIGYGDIEGKICIFKFLNIDEPEQAPQMKPIIFTDTMHTNTISTIEVFLPSADDSSSDNLRLITCSRDGKAKIMEFEDLKYYEPVSLLGFAQRKMIREDLKERIGFILFSDLESSAIFVKQELGLLKLTISLHFLSGGDVCNYTFEDIPKSFLLL